MKTHRHPIRDFHFACPGWHRYTPDRLDVDVLNALIGQMPMELRLELVATVGPDGVNPERELLDHVVEEVDGVLLGMPWVGAPHAA